MNPQKNTYENGANIFSPLGQYSMKSQNRKALASVEPRVEGEKKKNVAFSTCLLLNLGDQMLGPYIIQTASNCMALKGTGVHTSLQKDAATNLRQKKHCHLCPGIADAN